MQQPKIGVRFDACYPPAPLLVQAMIFVSTLLTTMLLRPFLFSTVEKAEALAEHETAQLVFDDLYLQNPEDPKVSPAASSSSSSGEVSSETGTAGTAGTDGTEKTPGPPDGIVKSVSESFVPWPCRVVLYTGCTLASVFGFVCFSNVAFGGAVFVAACELALVGATPWYSYEHETATFVFVVSLLAAQVALCVIYIRTDPRYSPWVYGLVVGVSLGLCALFGLHPFVIAYIRHLPKTGGTGRQKRRCTRTAFGWLERERLSWMEIMVGTALVTGCIMCPGELSS